MGLLLYSIIGLILAIFVMYNSEFTDDASVICIVSGIIVIGTFIFIAWPVFILRFAYLCYKEYSNKYTNYKR